MSELESARLFYALWPDETLRSRLVEAIGLLKAEAAGKWVPPENLHLTLVFLGDVVKERWPDLSRFGAAAAGQAFTVAFDRMEFWPWNGIVALGTGETPEALRNLVRRLSGRLAEAGFATESRPYRAHVTLARRGRSERTRMVLPEPILWTARSFCLVESRQARGGSLYIPRETWPLETLEAIVPDSSVT